MGFKKGSYAWKQALARLEEAAAPLCTMLARSVSTSFIWETGTLNSEP